MRHTCCAFTVTQLHQHHRFAASEPWKPSVFSSPLLAAHFVLIPHKQKRNGHCDWVGIDTDSTRHMLVPVASSLSPPLFNDEIDISTGTISSSQILDRNTAKGSGTTARGRRLLKIREEKRKREYDRLHNYPAWEKSFPFPLFLIPRVLEDAFKNDSELRAVLGDSIGNPELMRKKVEERVQLKGRDFQKSKTGSVLAYKVSFRDFNPVDSYIWFELFGLPSDRDINLVGSVIQSWYVMGRLGAFNSSNLQVYAIL